MSGLEQPRPAVTPEPPYTAVIFTSLRTEHDHGYNAAAEAMEKLAAEQPGYLGIESARQDLGITVSYWRDEAAAQAWKENVQHQAIQRRGQQDWYSTYTVRIATVTRQYGH
jgi:heme-degrading monooxygenase HmoA